MARGKHSARKKKKVKREWSKVMTLLVVLSGFVIAQEALFLMFYCIKNEYTSTAACDDLSFQISSRHKGRARTNTPSSI